MVSDVETFDQVANKFGLTSMEQNALLCVILAIARTTPDSIDGLAALMYVLKATNSNERLYSAFQESLGSVATT